MSTKKKLLFTGASGGLAKIIADRMKGDYEIYGIDVRPLRAGNSFPGEFLQLDYQHRKVAELFRTHEFHAMIHLGRLPMEAQYRKFSRFHTNVLGTKNLLELCLKHSVLNVIVMSTFHVYGAHQHNHLYITEDDPLLASHTFPEIADAVELDNISVAFSLKHREIRTLILRPVNIIGNRIHNQISKFLRTGACPVLMGYDPMQQFIHESDMAEAVVDALNGDQAGIYNIAGEGVIPFSKAVELAGSKSIPVPEFLKSPGIHLMKWIGFDFPNHLIEYFKYPVILSDRAFRRDFAYQPKVTTKDALESLITGIPGSAIEQ